MLALKQPPHIGHGLNGGIMQLHAIAFSCVRAHVCMQMYSKLWDEATDWAGASIRWRNTAT